MQGDSSVSHTDSKRAYKRNKHGSLYGAGAGACGCGYLRGTFSKGGGSGGAVGGVGDVLGRRREENLRFPRTGRCMPCFRSNVDDPDPGRVADPSHLR